MTEVNITEGPARIEAQLVESMQRMRDEAQRSIENKVQVRHGSRDPDGYNGKGAPYYLEEVIKRGVWRGKEYRDLLEVGSGFWGGDEEKIVRCVVSDKRVQHVAEAEVARYASNIGAKGVEIVKDYPDR